MLQLWWHFANQAIRQKQISPSGEVNGDTLNLLHFDHDIPCSRIDNILNDVQYEINFYLAFVCREVPIRAVKIIVRAIAPQQVFNHLHFHHLLAS